MAQTIAVGTTGEVSVKVTPDNTAVRFGNAGAEVFATPMLVALMEQAAIAAINPFLDVGEGSVGTKVNIAHLAATPIGMTVKAIAKVVETSGKKITFEVTAYDDKEKVGQGFHERFIINTASFLNKVAAKA